MASQTYRLVMRSGPTPEKAFELNRAVVTIGRDPANDFVINDAEVSRRHARLTAQAGGYVLEDTGSTNGTFVNGQRLMGPHLMRPGEMLLLGETVRLSFEMAMFDPDATMVTPSGEPYVPPAHPQPSASAPPVQPQAQPVYIPPSEVQKSPAYPPATAGAYPQAAPPPSAYYPPPPVSSIPSQAPAGKTSRTWLYAILVLLLVLLCLCGCAFIFDRLDLYCNSPFDALFGLFFSCTP